jgi:hypothetical protein
MTLGLYCYVIGSTVWTRQEQAKRRDIGKTARHTALGVGTVHKFKRRMAAA